MTVSDTLRLCVFDCDGTLVDSQDGIVKSMHAAFDAHGLRRVTDAAVRRVVGLPLEEAILRLGVDQALTPETADAVSDAYKAAFFELRKSGGLVEDLYPRAREAVEAVEAAGWLLGVATGKSRRGLDSTLERHRLAHHFQTLQTADIGPGKPAPDMLFRAMDEIGTTPEATVMIGDTTFDIEMARNAGVVAIGVAWGYHEVKELKAAGAHVVLDGFEQLAATIDQAFEGLAV